MPMEATAIDHINLSFPANELQKVIEFYVDTLGFHTDFADPYAAVTDDPGLFPILLGDGSRLYVNPTEEFHPEESNYRHLALRIPESAEDLSSFLQENDLTIKSTADRNRSSFGAYTSYYITDPFGYTIELMAIGQE